MIQRSFSSFCIHLRASSLTYLIQMSSLAFWDVVGAVKFVVARESWMTRSCPMYQATDQLELNLMAKYIGVRAGHF